MKITSLFLALFCLQVFAQGQFFDFSQLKLDVQAGARINYAIGNAKKTLLEDVKKSEECFPESFEYSSIFTPKTGLYFGFTAGLPLRESFIVGSGFLFSQKGYKQKTETSYTDPIYQYDYLEKEKATYSVNTLELPLWITYSFNDLWEIEAGILGAINFKSSLNLKESFQKKVWINGEEDIDWSQEKNTNKVKAPALNKSFNMGVYLKARRQIFDRMCGFASVQFDSGYIENGYGFIKDLSAIIGINYQIIL